MNYATIKHEYHVLKDGKAIAIPYGPFSRELAAQYLRVYRHCFPGSAITVVHKERTVRYGAVYCKRCKSAPRVEWLAWDTDGPMLEYEDYCERPQCVSARLLGY